MPYIPLKLMNLLFIKIILCNRNQNVHFQADTVENTAYKNPPGHNAQEDCVIQAFEA